MNWHQRIEEAEKRGRFTPHDHKHSLSWVTCACGEQDGRIERHSHGEPLDLKLADLGENFASAVGRNNFTAAREILEAIERRAAELLEVGG